MSAHTKKHRINKKIAEVVWNGERYAVPLQIMEKYRVSDNDDGYTTINELFGDLIEKYSEKGALLRGLRAKEGLTQIQLAKALGVTQANISAMENGRRPIGKEIAKRIQKKFKFNYRLFL